jgi:hypothetical protein
MAINTYNASHITQLYEEYRRKYEQNKLEKISSDRHDAILRFGNLYGAKIDVTDKRMIKRGAYSKMPIHAQYDYDIPSSDDIDNVVEITMPLSDLENFLKNFEQFMEIIDDMDDPRTRDMLEQLLMFIKLKT